MNRPPSSVDPQQAATRASVLGPGVSFDDYVLATGRDPQPGSRTLQALREAAFSGEIRFAAAPAIAVYADHGELYHAERADDPTISERLLAEGLVTREQLHRGMIVVGGQEHLGRIFDRDPSINRAAVLASANAHTNALVAEIAALPAVTAVSTRYRHHPSGIHRWFVGPAGIGLQRPVSEVAQIDRSVIEDLPEVIDPAPRIRIEWYEPDPTGDARRPGAAYESRPRDRASDDDHRPERANHDGVEAELADDVAVHLERFDADEADWGPGFEPFRDRRRETGAQPLVERRGLSDPPTAPTAHAGVDADDFSVVWPDGTREPTSGEPRSTEAGPAHGTTRESAPASHTEPEPTVAPQPEPWTTAPAPGSTEADVPKDVANAVRRALDAIEGAAGDDVETTAPRRIVIPPPPPPPADVTIETAPSANGFAPPTSDMRAEVVYARAIEIAEWDAEPEGDAAPIPPVASTVDDDEHGERRGALRRLINSLRRSN